MKRRITSAYYTRMNTSKETYIQDAEAVQENLEERLAKTQEVIRKCNDHVNELKELLDSINLDAYWYDEAGTELDAPDDFEWFKEVPEDDVDKYYDAYEDAWEIGRDIEHWCKRGAQLVKMLDELSWLEEIEND